MKLAKDFPNTCINQVCKWMGGKKANLLGWLEEASFLPIRNVRGSQQSGHVGDGISDCTSFVPLWKLTNQMATDKATMRASQQGNSIWVQIDVHLQCRFYCQL